ncbi:MAG: transposase [Bryobacteraceae bacterium]|jgi:REP element-mobilizing transposase RayT
MYYRRHLPHWIPDSAIFFVTWRLAGSAAPCEPEILTAENTGRLGFLAKDERLDGCGPFWLGDSRIAEMVESALRYGAATRGSYQLHAWVIMPNHVHVVLEPKIPLATIMRWLKGRTARMANQILGRTGLPFWQDESFDHWVRNADELAAIISYVEENPVKAGFVLSNELWRWSSARLPNRTDDENRSSVLHGFTRNAGP